MGHGGSLLCSQGLATCPYPEPQKESLRSVILFNFDISSTNREWKINFKIGTI
jgi:hypothetical protein